MELMKYEGLPIGSAARDFSLPAVDSRTYSLGSFKDKPILVVAFWCNHCPYVQAWEDRTVAVQRDFAGKGVQFVAINANDEESYPEDDFAHMVERSKRKGYNFPYLRDESQEVAESYGAVCTPDFFVFDSARKLRYRGKLDDSKDPARFFRVLFEFLHEFLGVQNRPRQLIHDGNRRSLRRPGERVQVDADDDLPHVDQRLGAVAVLQRDEDDIRPEDPVAVGESSLRLDARDPRVGSQAQDVVRPCAFENPDDFLHARFCSVEQVHLDSCGDRPCELHDFTRRERGHVSVHGNHRAGRREEMRRRGALRHEGRCARPLSEQVVPCFPAAMGDESLGDHNAFSPGPDEALPADEGFVPRMRPGDRHVIRWIAATNFPQPCQSGSAGGIPYSCSYVATAASTSSLVMFS